MAATLEGFLAGRGLLNPEEVGWVRRLAPGPLFPAQESVLADTGLLAGESLVVVSPTGTGKSLVGDVLAGRAMARRAVVLCLVSTRALARERHRQLVHAFGPEGWRVVVSTRDDRFHDEEILAGRIDLVVAVYEKARALFLRSAGFR